VYFRPKLPHTFDPWVDWALAISESDLKYRKVREELCQVQITR
jgi:hypothetical protein